MHEPAVFDLAFYRGDSYGWQVRLWQDAGASIPFDLTGATVAAEIRDKTAGLVVVELDVVVTLPNIVEIFMTPEMYLTCPAKGAWDLQITNADTTVLTVLRGAVTVTGDITDSEVMPARRARRSTIAAEVSR
jgi:hypothetical protein